MDKQRFVVTAGVWARIAPHLPGEKSDSGVTGKNNRLFQGVVRRYPRRDRGWHASSIDEKKMAALGEDKSGTARPAAASDR